MNGVSAAAANPKTFSQTYVKGLKTSRWQYSTTVNWESCEPTLEYIRYFKATMIPSYTERTRSSNNARTHIHTHTYTTILDKSNKIQDQWSKPLLEQKPANTIKLRFGKACFLVQMAGWQSQAGTNFHGQLCRAVLSRWISESTVTTVELVWNQTGVEFVWKWVPQDPMIYHLPQNIMDIDWGFCWDIPHFQTQQTAACCITMTRIKRMRIMQFCYNVCWTLSMSSTNNTDALW